MSIQMKNGCLVYYGNLIGYQAKNQTEVTVDPQFRREELESWLARRGLVPRWEEGVYERLSNEGFRVSDSSPELQSCRIWQLKPGTPIQMRFIGLDAMAQKFGGPTPEQYHVVYDGRIQDNDLEKLWNKFSRTPLGPDGQPLAISDVVELYNASGSTFFYIDSAYNGGFTNEAVGYTQRKSDNSDYDWVNTEKLTTVPGLKYTEGNYAKLAIARMGTTYYFFATGQFIGSETGLRGLNGEVVGGCLVFNMGIRVRNYNVINGQAQVEAQLQSLGVQL